jgi:hypothetical protein
VMTVVPQRPGDGVSHPVLVYYVCLRAAGMGNEEGRG